MGNLATGRGDRGGPDTERGRGPAPCIVTVSCLVCETVATVCRWPLVWSDEPYFRDPAVRLAEEGTFTSEISGQYGRQAEPLLPPPPPHHP